jgi:hypothetical protein
MKPLHISAETASKLSERLNMPIEHIMHMPQPILIQKLQELEKNDKENSPIGEPLRAMTKA